MNQCSPHLKPNSYTCFSKQNLVDITKSLNSLLDLSLKSSLNKKDLHTQLTTTFNQFFNCKTESCWLSQKKIIHNLPKKTKNDVLYYTFKPKSPIGKYFLLNTLDINLILIQYELIFPKFKFLGAVPSDTFNFSKDKNSLFLSLKSHQYIAIIFNLDTHDEPGSHWVSVFINTHSKTLEYFDSLGDPPIPNIQKFINLFPSYTIIVNTLEHQTGNTACGLYSILFILFKLKNPKNFEYLRKKLPDSKVHPFRSKFFRP